MRTKILFIILCFSLVTPAHSGRLDISNTKVNFVLIDKSKRQLGLFYNYKLIKIYNIALGSNPIGHKQRQGDGRTPEGMYFIDYKKQNSDFNLALRISYPDNVDKKRARKAGVNPGGSIMIHGLRPDFSWIGSLHKYHDWTDGCIAVSDDEIEEIFSLVSTRTPVLILP